MKRRIVPTVTFLLLTSCSDSGSRGDDSRADGGGLDGTVSESDASTRSDSGALESDSGVVADGGFRDASADAGGDAGSEPTVCDASKPPDLAGLTLRPVAQEIPKLVFAAQPPGSKDWYLVQQTGQVLLRADGSGVNTTLLDLSTELAVPNNNNDERGLLSIAFPPDFATTGLFYVMLTPAAGPSANTDQVRQYRKSGNTATLIETLVTVPASDSNHNGGSIAFGSDGMLYVGTGDGGGGCNSDKPDAPQDPASLYGKILRLDPNNKAGGFAASGNPYPANAKVWHVGLRNPFRFNFDRQTGDLYIGDVGQSGYEEVDYSPNGTSGLNFGWASYEGKMRTCPGREARAGDTLTEPIFVADQRMAGCSGPFCDWQSVIGGVVYRGNELPKLKGVYLFGDYTGARMVALARCEGVTSPVSVIRKNRSAGEPNTPYFAESGFGDLTAIVEGSDGELYFVANKRTLYKVETR